jgi:hypothetical protein
MALATGSSTHRMGAPLWLWIALAVPPLAALGDLEIAYALAPRACGDGTARELLLVSLASFGAAGAATAVAWRIARAYLRDNPHAAQAKREAFALLGWVAIALGLAACLTIAAMAVPRLALSCV